MKQTKFYDIHEKLGAKLVDFAGFKMPIQYTSIIEEHKCVRNSVGVFDVSHMGEVKVKGEKALDFVQFITVNDASKLVPGKVQYSAMCYEDAGIVDDLLVYKINDNEYMLVINASNIEKDLRWMNQNNSFGVSIIDETEEYSLLAVQGPYSDQVVRKLYPESGSLEYYTFTTAVYNDIPLLISRTGYTGELGYEIYFKGNVEQAEKIWNDIFSFGHEYKIKPVGLGARDSLRLEMGYCLYGNDIDQTTNTLEAGLGWITKLKKDNFIGKNSLLKVKENGLKRKLVAITSDEKCFPRHGYDITLEDKKIGVVTSGMVSPVTEKPIALAYVEIDYASVGGAVNFLIRGKEIPAKIVQLPFVKKII
ncbi:MAG: glycine cleavage system aminomethyltransferase GcvT [Melioribacteraceae bacterium]|nr:glycine cleavage system aminomethyltransferase GcvT [Melioribacteraceae bacterium]